MNYERAGKKINVRNNLKHFISVPVPVPHFVLSLICLFFCDPVLILCNCLEHVPNIADQNNVPALFKKVETMLEYRD